MINFKEGPSLKLASPVHYLQLCPLLMILILIFVSCTSQQRIYALYLAELRTSQIKIAQLLLCLIPNIIIIELILLYCIKSLCSNRSKILYEAGLRIVPIFRVGYSGYLCLALYSRMFYPECPSPNNRITQPEFSTPYRRAQLCIQTLFQVGHLERNMQLYGVGHSE